MKNEMDRPSFKALSGINADKKCSHVQVGMPPGFEKVCLNVMYGNGSSEGLPISKKVACCLIDIGIGVEG